MDRTHAAVTCLVVAIAMGCTAITGADDLSVDHCANDACVEKSETSPTIPAPDGTKQPSGGAKPAIAGVACGAATCGGATPKCCARTKGPSECIAEDGACNDGLALGCSGEKTCTNGTVCCLANDSGKPHGECRAASACVIPSVVLCEDNDECANHKCTGKIGGLDEYRVCSFY